MIGEKLQKIIVLLDGNSSLVEGPDGNEVMTQLFLRGTRVQKLRTVFQRVPDRPRFSSAMRQDEMTANSTSLSIFGAPYQPEAAFAHWNALHISVPLQIALVETFVLSFGRSPRERFFRIGVERQLSYIQNKPAPQRLHHDSRPTIVRPIGCNNSCLDEPVSPPSPPTFTGCHRDGGGASPSAPEPSKIQDIGAQVPSKKQRQKCNHLDVISSPHCCQIICDRHTDTGADRRDISLLFSFVSSRAVVAEGTRGEDKEKR